MGLPAALFTRASQCLFWPANPPGRCYLPHPPPPHRHTPPADSNIVLGISDPTVFYPPSSCDRVATSATVGPFEGPKLLNRHKYI